MYLTQTMFLGHIVLPLLCSYNLWSMHYYFPRWMFCTFTSVLFKVCAPCPTWLFSVVPWFPVTLLSYFLNDSEIGPVASIITGITFAITYHMNCISNIRSLYFRWCCCCCRHHHRHKPFLPGTSPLEPAVIPTAQASSARLQYFPHYVWCSKYSCLL